MYKYFSLLAISLWGLLALLGPIITTILFGEKFLYSWYLLQIAGGFIIFKILFQINFAFLNWLWKAKERSKALLFAVLINAILNIILINTIWAVWAVIATIIARFMIWLYTLKEIKKQITINFDKKYFFKNILLIGLLLLTIYFIKDILFIFNDSYRFHNLIYIIIIGITYYWIIWLFNYKDILILKKEIKKIKNSRNKE